MMFQGPDYTILDHLTEICEVVDFNLCYLYVNDAALEREYISRDKLIGRKVLEVHPDIKATYLFLHLKECLEKRKSFEFEDKSSYPNSAITRWKIKDRSCSGRGTHPFDGTILRQDKSKDQKNGGCNHNQWSSTAPKRSMACIQQRKQGSVKGFAD